MDQSDGELLEVCIKTGRDAGCPRDQISTLVSSGYIPLPWQWGFHAASRLADMEGGPVDIGLGGARGPGKSHAILSQVGLDDCQRVSSLKGLFLRQTGIAAKESFDDLVNKTLKGRVNYEKTGNNLRFPNDSKILLGGFKDEGDIDKYVGIEYDFIVVEELNQLTEDKYTKLRGSLRTSKPDWRPRMYTSFNPGGKGHAFVKSRYIEPNRSGTEKQTRFLGSTYTSNPYLNKEYTDYLESLTGDLGKAWREGEWDLFAGQAFTELERAVHIVKPFELPSHTKYWAGFDWGYNHPIGFVLFATVDGKEIYVVNYLNTRMLRPDQAAVQIKNMLGNKRIYAYCGHDMWNNNGRSTIYEELNSNLGGQVTLVKATLNRIQRVSEIRKKIAHRGTASGRPSLYFFENAEKVFDVISSMQYSQNVPEDVAKMDADAEGNNGDDLYDGFGYGLMAYVTPNALSFDISPNTGSELMQMIEDKRNVNNLSKIWR